MKFTLLGRILIALAVLGIGYLAFTKLGGEKVVENLNKENTESTTGTEETSEASASSTSSSSASSESSSENNTEATASSSKRPFSFKPLPPVNGRLKGVVELGASGFNSFIIRVDEDKNWSLEKAEFGNSLVTENMATDTDIREGLKKYIGEMLDFGVSAKAIHFVVSSGAQKAAVTQKIISALKTLNYQVNTVTPEKEGKLGLTSVLPTDYQGNSFVVDIGSGNTKISWKVGSGSTSVETYGSKYYDNNTSDQVVFDDVLAKAKMVPSGKRKTCFIIGGVPFDMAKISRNGKERYTVLDAPSFYKMDKAKGKAGINIYKAIIEATGTEQFVFDWDANFTIGFLLELP
jgi:hypothetical protein